MKHKHTRAPLLYSRYMCNMLHALRVRRQILEHSLSHESNTTNINLTLRSIDLSQPRERIIIITKTNTAVKPDHADDVSLSKYIICIDFMEGRHRN